jgi:hypothetical protein
MGRLKPKKKTWAQKLCLQLTLLKKAKAEEKKLESK